MTTKQAIHINGKSYPGISATGVGFVVRYDTAAEILGITHEKAEEKIAEYDDEFEIARHIVLTDESDQLWNLGHLSGRASFTLVPWLTMRGFSYLCMVACGDLPQKEVIAAFMNPTDLANLN